MLTDAYGDDCLIFHAGYERLSVSGWRSNAFDRILRNVFSRIQALVSSCGMVRDG